MKVKDILMLTEATFNLDEQVDYIYDKHFAPYAEDIRLSGAMNFNPVVIKSTSLPSSPEIDRANEINPVDIIIHKTSYGNMYIPASRKIYVNFSDAAARFISQYGGIDRAVSALRNDGQISAANRLKLEFTPARVKGSIHHELSHWLDDSLHNRHIANRLMRSQRVGVHDPTGAKSIVNQGHPDVAMTEFERDAQIHSIIQLKRQYKSIWDSISFTDMLELNASLNQINHKGKREGWGDEWRKLLLRRMHREGLLGKSM